MSNKQIQNTMEISNKQNAVNKGIKEQRLQYATEDLEVLMNEGSLMIAGTIKGTLFCEYKKHEHGVEFNFSATGLEVMTITNQESALLFIASIYAVEYL